MENTVKLTISEKPKIQTTTTPLVKIPRCTPCQFMLVFGIVLSLIWVTLLFIKPFKTSRNSTTVPFSSSIPNANWSTFSNPTVPLTLDYPVGWSVIVRPPETEISLLVFKDNNGSPALNISLLAQFNERYCDTHSTEERCELMNVGSQVIEVDWGDGAVLPNAYIRHDANAGVFFEISNANVVSNEMFKKILSTFRYRESPSVVFTPVECEEMGGVWQEWGLAQEEYCQIPAPDAGKECIDGSECSLGYCISDDDQLPGKCQTYHTQFGCYSRVENGISEGKICVD